LQVWVDGPSAHPGEATLIRWNGQAWQQVPVHGPDGVNLLFGMSHDGTAGIWVAAQSQASGLARILHRSAAGQWTSTPLESGGRFMNDTVLIPGTHSLWEAGQSFPGPGYATIWAEGPHP
jgi:hypothetical protein